MNETMRSNRTYRHRSRAAERRASNVASKPLHEGRVLAARLSSAPASWLRVSGPTLLIACLAIWTLGLGASALKAQDYEEERVYSAVRFLEGEATLQNVDSAERIEVEPNYPVLTGDRLWVPPGSRVHLSLADGSLLAVGGGTEVVFDQIARSLDSDDTTTRLRLLQGRLDLLVDTAFEAAELPIIDTANARLFVQAEYTRLAVGANHTDWTEVTTREGLVEVLTPNGSSLVRPDEELVVRGIHDTTVDLAQAAPLQDLELWASDSADRLARYSYDDLDEPLRETAQLTDHGDWVEVEGSVAWRPRVAATWRPYSSGRWVHTPTGLYWAAYDPWSPVTYHYGGWDLHPRWGWVWYPGYRYAPAHVAWYFGPDYYGWIPTTYYRRHYGFHLTGFGFRFGIWGRAGGYWDPFYDWTFCPTGYFGARRGYRHYRSGYHYRDRGRLGHGYVTTDTTYVTKDSLRNPDRIYRDLESKRVRGAELVDVTPMLARGKEVPESVRKAILVRGETQTVAKVASGVRSAKATSVSGAPRAKERGVSRATLGQGSTVKRGTIQRGTVGSAREGTKSATAVPGRSAVSKSGGQREPAQVIVDGVRRGNDRGSASGKSTRSATTNWRSTDRVRAPSSARPSKPSGTDRGKVTASPSQPRRPTPSARPSAPPSSPKVRPPVTSRERPTASPKSTARPPRATAAPSKSRPPKATPPPRSSSGRSTSVSGTSRPRTKSASPSTSSGRSPRATSSRSSSARPQKSTPPRSVRGASTSSRSPRASSSRSSSVRSPKASSSRSSVRSSSSAKRSTSSARASSSRSSSVRSSKAPASRSSTRSAPSRSSSSGAKASRSSSRSSKSSSGSSGSRPRPSKPPAL